MSKPAIIFVPVDIPAISIQGLTLLYAQDSTFTYCVNEYKDTCSLLLSCKDVNVEAF